MSQHLLPSENGQQHLSKPKSTQARSVRSLRARFESSSSRLPPLIRTPEKERAEAQTQLRHLVAKRRSEEENRRANAVASGEQNPESLGSVSTVDTFCISSYDLPRTDPVIEQRLVQSLINRFEAPSLPRCASFSGDISGRLEDSDSSKRIADTRTVHNLPFLRRCASRLSNRSQGENAEVALTSPKTQVSSVTPQSSAASEKTEFSLPNEEKRNLSSPLLAAESSKGVLCKSSWVSSRRRSKSTTSFLNVTERKLEDDVNNRHLYEEPPAGLEGIPEWGAIEPGVKRVMVDAQHLADKAVKNDETDDLIESQMLYTDAIRKFGSTIPFLSDGNLNYLQQCLHLYTGRCAEIVKKLDELRNKGSRGMVDEDQDNDEANVDVVKSDESDDANTERKVSKAGHPCEQFNKSLGSMACNATLKKHRESLKRPISAVAIQKAAPKVSEEHVIQVQEKFKLVKEALHNFTVKRAHLGPARAVELAITELNASSFGNYKKLEPLAPEVIRRWNGEIGVLLEMLKQIQVDAEGGSRRTRSDIEKHLPNLQRCDERIIDVCSRFGFAGDEVKFTARDKGEKWWVDLPELKAGGLPSKVRKELDNAKKELEMLHKLARDANVEILRSMAIPRDFKEHLPKHARHVIRSDIKKHLARPGPFDVRVFMLHNGLYCKGDAKSLCSALEKVVLIWGMKARLKSHSFTPGKPPRFPGSIIRDLLGLRNRDILEAIRKCRKAIDDIRNEFLTMGHTELDVVKIATCEDIGHAGLEAYSRALESRAHIILQRVLDIIQADDDSKSTISS